MHRKNFDVVMVLWSPERMPTAMRIFNYLVSTGLARHGVVVINNERLPAEDVMARLADRKRTVEIVRHDNAGAEFGGYQRGAEICFSRGADGVVLANDTAGVHQFLDRRYLRRFAERMAHCEDGPFCIGRVVTASETLQLANFETRTWIRSHFIGLNRAAYDALNGRIWEPSYEAFVNETSSVDKFFGPEFGDYLKGHLAHWLFGSGKTAWYRAQPLTDSSASFLAMKARSIVQEMGLAMRLQAKQTDIENIDPYASRDLPTRARRWLWHRTKLLAV